MVMSKRFSLHIHSKTLQELATYVTAGGHITAVEHSAC